MKLKENYNVQMRLKKSGKLQSTNINNANQVGRTKIKNTTN